jgi:hypothetical protein
MYEGCTANRWRQCRPENLHRGQCDGEGCRVLFYLHPPFSRKGLWIQEYIQTVSQADWNNRQCSFIGFNLQARFQDREKRLSAPIMSVRPSAWKNSAPIWQIFMKICIWVYLENLWRKFKFHSNLVQITVLSGTPNTIFYLSLSFPFTMRNLTDKVVGRINPRLEWLPGTSAGGR